MLIQSLLQPQLYMLGIDRNTLADFHHKIPSLQRGFPSHTSQHNKMMSELLAATNAETVTVIIWSAIYYAMFNLNVISFILVHMKVIICMKYNFDSQHTLVDSHFSIVGVSHTRNI